MNISKEYKLITRQSSQLVSQDRYLDKATHTQADTETHTHTHTDTHFQKDILEMNGIYGHAFPIALLMAKTFNDTSSR